MKRYFVKRLNKPIPASYNNPHVDYWDGQDPTALFLCARDVECPVCEKEGLRSYVYPGAMMSTLMGFTPYYDEAGNYHVHNPNRTTKTYTCSNDHKWSETEKGQCPSCDYGKDSGKTIINEQKETK